MPLSQGHDRQSRSPARLTRWYRLCAARVFPGDCHERVPWYAVHPPVSTPFSSVTAAPRGCLRPPRARVTSRIVSPGFSSASRPMELLRRRGGKGGLSRFLHTSRDTAVLGCGHTASGVGVRPGSMRCGEGREERESGRYGRRRL